MRRGFHLGGDWPHFCAESGRDCYSGGLYPNGAPVILTTSFLAIGTINEAVGNATGNDVAQAFIHMSRKLSGKPILTMVRKKDMTKLIPKEMMRLINRLPYFG